MKTNDVRSERVSAGGGDVGTPESTRSIARWFRRRRTAIAFLALFGVVAWAKPMGLLLWARIRILTSLPKTAIADDPSVAAELPKEPAAPAEFDPGLHAIPGIRTDPFRIDPHIFPKATPVSDVAPTPEPVPKPEVPSVDEARREASRAAVRAAERFRLQAAGRGLSMAVIDGRTYRIGDTIDGEGDMRFTLVEVLEGAAIVEWNGERFELRLRSAGGRDGPTQGSSSGGGTRD
jgi:hypothetical protein